MLPGLQYSCYKTTLARNIYLLKGWFSITKVRSITRDTHLNELLDELVERIGEKLFQRWDMEFTTPMTGKDRIFNFIKDPFDYCNLKGYEPQNV